MGDEKDSKLHASGDGSSEVRKLEREAALTERGCDGEATPTSAARAALATTEVARRQLASSSKGTARAGSSGAGAVWGQYGPSKKSVAANLTESDAAGPAA